MPFDLHMPASISLKEKYVHSKFRPTSVMNISSCNTPTIVAGHGHKPGSYFAMM